MKTARAHRFFLFALSLSLIIPYTLNSATGPRQPKNPEPPKITPQPPEPPKPPALPPAEPPTTHKEESSSKIELVDPANKIVTTIGWENDESWFKRFLDSGDVAFIDQNGRPYG